MNVAHRVPAMTRDQFLDWAARQDVPHEFDGLVPIAMTGGNKRHSKLCRNLTAEIWARVDRASFDVLPEAGIATVGQAVRYPDLLVTGSSDPDEARLITEPLIVFEVLSPSSGRVDHAVKLREYRAVASIRRYVIVDNTGPELTVYARLPGAWDWLATSITSGETLEMPEIGIEVPVDEIFAGVMFD